MNNTMMDSTPITLTSVGMALISIAEVQQLTYIAIAVVSLMVTIISTIMSIKQNKQVNQSDLDKIENKLEDLKNNIKKGEDDDGNIH